MRLILLPQSIQSLLVIKPLAFTDFYIKNQPIISAKFLKFYTILIMAFSLDIFPKNEESTP